MEKENPFAESNNLIEKFMKENNLEPMHIEIFIQEKHGKICVDETYYQTLEETENSKGLFP